MSVKACVRPTASNVLVFAKVVYCRSDSWRQGMKASLLYRIASVLLVLFAVGHILGFRQNNPDWKAEAVLGLMQSVHFNAIGFNRTYWDFFSAFGFFFSVFLVFAAVLAWQLS